MPRKTLFFLIQILNLNNYFKFKITFAILLNIFNTSLQQTSEILQIL